MPTQDQLTKKFNLEIKELSKAVGISVDLAMRKIAFDAFNLITQRTPVDTGYARASWELGVNSPNPNSADESDYPKGSANESKAAAENRTKVSGVDASKAKLFFITNDLPYIQALENGHSKQSNKGFMINRTIKDLQKDVSKTIKKFLP